jgi:SAM-dependent methyltransferase
VNPYDELPFTSGVQPRMQPDRLATVASLRGLSPAHPLRCRMLDLACGDGMNVLGCAQAAPESEFLGVDLAEAPVARGSELAAAAGLRNVRIVRGDFTAPDPAWGTFDYVVAHGVYSWVPAAARERLVATVAASLRPGGVACIRYRVKPGSIARDMFRRLMLLHTESAATTDDRVRQALEFLRFLRAARSMPGDPWDDWVRSELDDRLRLPPGHVRHDDLGDVNEPVWYREFAEQAARHGLVCLGDAEWSQDTDVAFSEEVRAAIDRHADPVEREQYRDLLKFRRMRETVLVRRDEAPTGGPRLERIPSLVVSARLRGDEAPPPLGGPGEETFRSHGGGGITAGVPIVRAALRILAASWPQRFPFEGLLRRAAVDVAAARGEASSGATAPSDADREGLVRLVTSLHDGGVVELHTHAPSCAREAGERPVASALARVAAQRGARVVTLLQRELEVTDARSLRLVAMLDGTLDRSEILARLAAAEAPPATPPEGQPPLTPEVLDAALARLARWGALVA